MLLHPNLSESLKIIVGEDDSPHILKEQLDQCRKYDFNPRYMTVIPVSFNHRSKEYANSR